MGGLGGRITFDVVCVEGAAGLEIEIREFWVLMFLGEIIRLFHVCDIVLIESGVPGPFVCAVQRLVRGLRLV